MDFTGEFFVPGKSGERIEADHQERYRFASTFAHGKSVLDIACGVGYAAPIFLSSGATRYVGVDLNEELIDYAGRTYGASNVQFTIGDICTYRDGTSYNLVTCFETIEHVAEYRLALNNLYRLVKPGGMLIISSPNRQVTSPRAKSLTDPPLNTYHAQEFIPEELLSELRLAGFSVDEHGLYGQRQRQRIYVNRFIRKIVSIIYGNLDTITSPQVTPVRGKVPRYFICVAKKQ